MSPRREEEPQICEISGCSEEAVRSIPKAKIKGALPDASFDKEGRRIHICKKHYKQYRKKTKQDREIERLGWQQ